MSNLCRYRPGCRRIVMDSARDFCSLHRPDNANGVDDGPDWEWQPFWNQFSVEQLESMGFEVSVNGPRKFVRRR